MMRMSLYVFSLLFGLVCGVEAAAADVASFRAGSGERDITPPPGLPMWGYGARHDALAEGTLDPLRAKAIVIAAGEDKLALVGLDLGRGPTAEMMDIIRREVAAKAGIRHVLISGSHTHHGPVIELTDQPGLGQGKFAAAVAYSQSLPNKLVEAILEADHNLKTAKIGIATKSVPLNRNRHSKRPVKPTDPLLAIMRLDDEADRPIAILVNFAAHPVLTETKILNYSADYPGFLQKKVESALGTRCIFIQGAAGDMSVNPGEVPRTAEAFGEAMADHVLELARPMTTESPKNPSIAAKVHKFHFTSRVDLGNPLIALRFERAFFPEIVRNYAREFANGIDAELATVLLNGEIALVGVPGEFFCNHAVRFRERAYVKHTFFFGYCNGHAMYFPTIEAASEGGYGADPGVSLVEIGAGEQMMNQALIDIYTLLGKFPSERH